MRALAPRVARDAAWQRLNRRGLGQRFADVVGRVFRRSLAKVPPALNSVKLPALETVWLPYFRVAITMRDGDRQSVLEVLVDSHDGRGKLADLAVAEWIELPASNVGLSGKLSCAEAEAAARECVVRALLSRPGWGKRPAIESVRDCQPIGYPVWAYYFANRAGMLDAKLLDAMTGADAGPGFKTSLLATLAARQQI